jgi:hemoglobin
MTQQPRETPERVARTCIRLSFALPKGIPVTTIRTACILATLTAGLFAASAGAQDKTLYQRLGGYDAIAAVTDEFIGRLATDDQEKRFFVGFSTDSKMRIRQLIVDLICKSTGGPCVYSGRDMKTAHAGAGITKSDWDHTLQIFGEVLNKFKVPEKEQKELAALLAPLEKDIVDK